MRLLITGASGLLGMNLALDACRTHAVVGVCRTALAGVPFRAIQADLLEASAVERVMDDAVPEAVIHCAAAADVDFCERNPDVALRMNARVPAQIAESCAQRRVRFIHISTDAVFDGEKPGYYEESDLPRPTGTYAATKYEGEQVVLLINPEAIVARVNFYGWSLSGTRSLAEFFVNSLSRGESISGFVDVTFCPMMVSDLGRLLLRMLESDLHGLYHAVGPQAMTKYQFGVEIGRRFSLDVSRISPQSVDKSGLAARRAHNLRLSTHKLSTALDRQLPDFSTGLEEFFKQYQQGLPQKMRSYQQGAGGAG
jgi:dTDP-4-dehydrorhamnose reductase